MGLETVVHLDPHLLFGQVADVAHGGPDVETVSQKPLQSPGLGRRLDDDQSFRHSSLFIPKPGLLFPTPRLRRASYARSLPRRNALTYPPWCRLTAPSSSRAVSLPRTSAIGSWSLRAISAAFKARTSERWERMP